MPTPHRVHPDLLACPQQHHIVENALHCIPLHCTPASHSGKCPASHFIATLHHILGNAYKEGEG
eukprot:scaffold36494_cov22-Tisochrysis_lutea.AAC.2